MIKHVFSFSLRTQLLIVMVSIMLISLSVVTYFQQVTEEKLFQLIKEEINELTKVIQISVEQITTQGSTDEARLKNYIDTLRKKGIKEISILGSDQEVIMSSNPQRVGSKLSVTKNEFVIRADFGDVDKGPKKLYNVIIPVVIQDTLAGYVHLSLHLEDFEKMSKEMLYRRIAFSLSLFSVGILLCIAISYGYTKPISQLIGAIRSIADNKTPVLPKTLQKEIRALADSLREMAEKLQKQKETEEKLKQTEKQAVLAQLASGIAHEIRNPINFINLSLDHLHTLKHIEIEKSSLTTLIKKMKDEVQRLNKMVSNFLDLGRELMLHRMPLRADLPVEEAIGLSLHRLQKSTISIERSYCNPLPLVAIDVEKMKACFLNIIQNAADAMPDGGTLEVTIEKIDGLITFTFADNGKGIIFENLGKVFEPYFTTKETGIGLGLAIAKRVVEAHDGKIKVKSTPEKGTRVSVLLPA